MRVEEYVATRVKELCVKYKVTKYRLSQLTGMSQTALGNIMNMKSMPTVLTLEKICDAILCRRGQTTGLNTRTKRNH